jgi:hypothetical protein
MIQRIRPTLFSLAMMGLFLVIYTLLFRLSR